jgi:aminoglycoside phosphotransferase (APT) family kinase protein
MSEQKQILEQYLKARFCDKTALSITRLEKIADGWESDNYMLTVEYGDVLRTRDDWVWRIYSGAGNREKAVLEFTSMEKLFSAEYPVPRVFLLEADHSPIDRPFIMMEFIQGEMMWRLLDNSSEEKQKQLLDQFCQLYVQLHNLDWKLFDDSLPTDDPHFFIDQWLAEARGVIQRFPDFDASTFLDWVMAQRDLLTCERPSPIQQDFHPGNILVRADDSAVVIDWAHFAVSDFRFDLSWTLVLTYAHGWTGMRDLILQGYEHHLGKSVDQIEIFEAIACARRLFDLTISLTFGPEHLGMTNQAVESIRSSMEAHRRVHRLFIERTGLHVKAFDELFGRGE